MQVTIEFKSGTQFEIQARDHRIVSDQPESNKGADTGMTPPELLLASLGSCAGYYAVEYLRARGLPLEIRVRMNAEKAVHPARIGKIRLDLHVPDLDERHRQGLMRAVHACLVHNTLSHPPEIEYVLHAAENSEDLVTRMH